MTTIESDSVRCSLLITTSLSHHQHSLATESSATSPILDTSIITTTYHQHRQAYYSQSTLLVTLFRLPWRLYRFPWRLYRSNSTSRQQHPFLAGNNQAFPRPNNGSLNQIKALDLSSLQCLYLNFSCWVSGIIRRSVTPALDI